MIFPFVLNLLFVSLFIIYLFYILTAVSPSFSPSSPFTSHPVPMPQSIPPLFLFRKGQGSHEYQENMTKTKHFPMYLKLDKETQYEVESQNQ